MATTATQQGFVVRGPFDDGDCLLRSVDKIDFHVYRLVLSLASSVFKDMFSIPQPPAAPSGGLPVIDLEEDAETLDALLRSIYPVHDPDIKSIKVASSLARACAKYDLPISCLVPIKAFLSANVSKEPVQTFAAAWVAGFREIATLAAYKVRDQHLETPDAWQSLVEISGGYHILVALDKARKERSKHTIYLAAYYGLGIGEATCPTCRNNQWRLEAKARDLSQLVVGAVNVIPGNSSDGHPTVTVGTSDLLSSSCRGCSEKGLELKGLNPKTTASGGVHWLPELPTKPGGW